MITLFALLIPVKIFKFYLLLVLIVWPPSGRGYINDIGILITEGLNRGRNPRWDFNGSEIVIFSAILNKVSRACLKNNTNISPDTREIPPAFEVKMRPFYTPGEAHGQINLLWGIAFWDETVMDIVDGNQKTVYFSNPVSCFNP